MATPGATPKAHKAALKGLVAVDGTLLKALPGMAWALWQSATHRAAKAHIAFAVFPGAPEQVSVTSGNASERHELRRFVKPGGFYVADRATNARELPGELLKVASKYRWQVELFFCWMKCILGCRHLLSQSQSGVTLQVYAAIIASI